MKSVNWPSKIPLFQGKEFFSKIQILIKCVKMTLSSTMKKYAVDAAIHFLTKSTLRPTVLTETTRQRWS